MSQKRSLWKKPTTYVIIGVLALFMIFVAKNAKAEETIFEIAPVVAYAGDYQADRYAVMMTERFKGKYDIGILLLVDTRTPDYDGNRALQVLRTAQRGNWEIGFGFAFWGESEHEAWNADETFAITVGYQKDNWSIRLRHYSTGGSSTRNRGLDMLTVGYTF